MVIDTNEQSVVANELRWVSDLEASEPANATADEALAVVARDYPRIAKSVSELWGKAEFDVYMEKLLIDERGGRAGFPLNIADALLRLSRMHAECYGFGKPDDIWIDIDLRAKRNN